MRISSYEAKAIADLSHKFFGPMVKVCLFGSRVDDQKKGGDIDLLIQVPIDQVTAAKANKYKFIDELQGSIGEQRIDVVIAAPEKIQEDEFLQSLDCIEL